MTYYCRQNLLHADGHLIGYKFHDSKFVAYGKGWTEPETHAEAQSQCQSWSNGSYDAIDGIMTYATGASSASATLTDIFSMPVSEDLQQMWMLGFGLPIITYLTAWGYGVVINWFNEKRHR